MKKALSIICAAGLDNFLAWVPFLKDEYDVRVFRVTTQEDLEAGIRWGDILWYEWANEVAIAGTAHMCREEIDKPTIVRLHSYEAFSDMPSRIGWSKVDALVYVAPHVREINERYNSFVIGCAGLQVETIPNGVDLDGIPDLNPGPGTEIAVVGSINHKKEPALVLQVLDQLLETSGKPYRVHWAGAFQDPRFEVYLRHMVEVLGQDDAVKFYGHVDDMGSFWRGKNYLLHTSLHEGHSYAIMEAMARNIKPAIHDYYGAEDQYPGALRFNTIAEAVNIITTDRGNDISFRECLHYWGWTVQEQVRRIRDLIGRVAS